MSSCKVKDISCEDGICPDCNYQKYKLWLDKHLHCDQESWVCPDENDCPHNRDYPICWVDYE